MFSVFDAKSRACIWWKLDNRTSSRCRIDWEISMRLCLFRWCFLKSQENNKRNARTLFGNQFAWWIIDDEHWRADDHYYSHTFEVTKLFFTLPNPSWKFCVCHLSFRVNLFEVAGNLMTSLNCRVIMWLINRKSNQRSTLKAFLLRHFYAWKGLILMASFNASFIWRVTFIKTFFTVKLYAAEKIMQILENLTSWKSSKIEERRLVAITILWEIRNFCLIQFSLDLQSIIKAITLNSD